MAFNLSLRVTRLTTSRGRFINLFTLALFASSFLLAAATLHGCPRMSLFSSGSWCCTKPAAPILLLPEATAANYIPLREGPCHHAAQRFCELSRSRLSQWAAFSLVCSFLFLLSLSRRGFFFKVPERVWCAVGRERYGFLTRFSGYWWSHLRTGWRAKITFFFPFPPGSILFC